VTGVTTRNRFGIAAGKAALSSIVVTMATATGSWPNINVSEAAQSSSSVAQCIQGQLQVAIEQGGGLQVHTALGYTFLIVNTGARSCELRGYPRETAFSTRGGQLLKVSKSHHRSALFAQPKVQSVVLRPAGVASFGISYIYQHGTSEIDTKNCMANLIDVRLPARASNFFSYEFAVSIDICEAGRQVEVTPVENRAVPLA
jgi:hypothetical protein